METINDLFQKYVMSAGPVLEEDRYFQYLYESVAAADDKTIEQKAQTLHKVVDEEWLTVVEDALDSINTIIEKPRRFIARSEELVPVSLAKKITADSVRHLSQNTQFINSDENGEVNPNKILNVTNEDSYDLYENRFIYHLIQRLVVFIDKRTDVIFWSTGDETRNVMKFQTRVDDAYEQIEYSLEMKITNRQSFAENDADNMTVFMRIDRVRRLVMALRQSSFCEIMAGCAKVRSPIQRTNLMMKDRDYRKCYALWQFLERYDDVGYSIVEQDKAYEIDEEYLIQLYSQFITAYALFKTLTGDDRRDVEQLLDKKRKVHKPKFIKQIREEIVENRDLPDVEVRRIFVEEVTQAQLDAEEALAKERALTADLQGRIDGYARQAETARVLREDAEAARAHAEQKMSEAIEAKNRAEENAQNAANNAAIRIANAEKNAAVKIAEAESIRKAAEMERDDAKGAAFAAEQKAYEATKAMKAAVEESEALTAEANRKIAEVDEKIAAAERRADIDIRDARARADEEIAAAKEDAAKRIETAESNATERIAKAEADAEARVSAADRRADEKSAESARIATERIAAAETNAEEKISAAERNAKERIDAAEQAARDTMGRAEEMQRKAEALSADADERVKTAAAEQAAAEQERDTAIRERLAALEQSETDRAAKNAAEEAAKQAERTMRDSVAAAENAKNLGIRNAEDARDEAIRSANEKEQAASALEAEANRLIAEARALKEAAENESKAASEELARAKTIASEAEAMKKDAERTAREARRSENAAKRAEEKALRKLERETKARLRAEEKAKEGTFSRTLAARLFGTKPASGEPEEPEPKDEPEEHENE